MATPIDADLIAGAFDGPLIALADRVPDGWVGVRDETGTSVVVTGLPAPSMNGVWALHRSRATAEVLEAALDSVADHEVPYCLQARPACREAAAEAARTHGLVLTAQDIPLMAVQRPISAATTDVTIRSLGPDRSDVHAELAARAFDGPLEVFRILTDAVLQIPGARLYVGELDDEPVTTALSVTIDGAVAVFNVATPPEHRRRGYGAAITAVAVNDGLAGGARYGWLQSTEHGVGVYAHLGFETLERWSCWTSA